MARVFSSLTFNQNELSLYRINVNAYDSYFFDDVYFTSDGSTYEDVLEIYWSLTGTYVLSAFGGSGIVVNSAGAVTGGQITGYMEFLWNGAAYQPFFGIDGFSASAAALYAAGLTSGTGDDRAIIDQALSGNDEFSLSQYADVAYGRDGDDAMTGSGGDDFLAGGPGSDAVFGGAGNDTLAGGAGDDTVYGAAGSDTMRGGDGADLLGGGDGADSMDGGNGLDILWTSNGHDTARGGRGDDTLGGAAGDDSLSGNEGADEIWGGFGNDILSGGADDDLIGGALGHDTISGDAGNDEIWGAGGADRMSGGDGADSLGGGTGDDFADGGAGNDILFGGPGADSLRGGAGDDTLFGGIGADRLLGGSGNDTIYLGGDEAEADQLVFNAGDGADHVLFFSATADRLQLDERLWGGGLTGAEVVTMFGQAVGGDFVLDFGGGDVLTLAGLGGVTGLDSQVEFI